MSGLVAVFDRRGLRLSFADLLHSFPSRALHRDIWHDRRFAAARLHHGKVDPAPQPVWNKEGTFCLFLDGEVFAGETLDETMPADHCLALLRDDPEAFADLNGSFAAIGFDLQAVRILVVTDRLATRPLFYFQYGTEFVVASHVATLMGHPRCPRSINLQSVHELLAYRQVLGSNTLYEGIRWAEPGSITSFDGDRERVQRYWHLRWREPGFAREELPERLAEGFRKSVGRRLSRDLRHALFLSGGLDSRIILAAAKEPPTCLTLGDEETEQIRCAREAAELSGAEHSFITVEPDAFQEHFEEGVRLTGGSYGYQQNHFLPVLDTARGHADVALTGNYLDTIFRGTFLPSRKISLCGSSHKLPALVDLPDGDLTPLLVNGQKQGFPSALVGSVLAGPARAGHERRLALAMRSALTDFDSPWRHHAWNHLVIRSISHNFAFPNVNSIRSRMDVSVVAWDHDLLDLALQMPPDWCWPDDMYRKALEILSPPLAGLRYANDGLPATSSPYFRTAYGFAQGAMRAVDTRLLDRRPKRGPASWLDFDALLRRPGPLHDRLLRLPDSEPLMECGIFDRAGLQAVVGQHLSRRHNVSKLLLILLTIENWLEQFGGHRSAGHASAA